MLFCSFQTSANTSHCFVILIKFAPSSIIRVWTYDQFSQSIGCDHKSNTYIFGKYDKYLSKRSESSQTIHFWPFMDQSRIIIRSGTPFCRHLHVIASSTQSCMFVCLQCLGTLQNNKPVPQVLKQVVSLSCYTCFRYLEDQLEISLEMSTFTTKMSDDEIIINRLVANPIHVFKLIRRAIRFTDECLPQIQQFLCNNFTPSMISISST